MTRKFQLKKAVITSDLYKFPWYYSSSRSNARYKQIQDELISRINFFECRVHSVNKEMFNSGHFQYVFLVEGTEDYIDEARAAINSL